MADNDEKKSLEEKLKGSINSVKSAAKSITLPLINVPNIKMPPVRDLLQKKESDPPSAEEESVPAIESISTRSALKIFYYLMAADGKLAAEEEAKFDLLGHEIAPDYDSLKERVVADCRVQMSKIFDPEDYYDVIQEGVERALAASVKTEDSFITPKLLVWDLMTIAYSEGEYDERERKLIKYVVRKLNIDKAVFLEMESSIQTLMDLEKEQQWIKTTDRQYLTIEGMVNEIEDRKHVIFDSVKELISL